MLASGTVEVYLPLLEEGTPTLRPTQAIFLGNDLYQLLPTPDYDPEDEVWEFPPGSVVRCIRETSVKKPYLYAVEMIKADGTIVRSTGGS